MSIRFINAGILIFVKEVIRIVALHSLSIGLLEYWLLITVKAVLEWWLVNYCQYGLADWHF
jgi:hypothetical protein